MFSAVSVGVAWGVAQLLDMALSLIACDDAVGD